MDSPAATTVTNATKGEDGLPEDPSTAQIVMIIVCVLSVPAIIFILAFCNAKEWCCFGGVSHGRVGHHHPFQDLSYCKRTRTKHRVGLNNLAY
jgi:hypothetical protein